MTNAKLLIQQQPSSESLTQEFALIGTIDVDASRVLETLYVLPAKASAELNFAQVEWVNSMGLAQLFKLFEHWKKQEINVRITRANQTVCVLLNQTGLAHLLADEQHHAHGIHKVESQPVVTKVNPQAMSTLDVEPPVLQISPTPTPEMINQQFSLIGNIDVAAVQLLLPLYCLPANSKVELNFSQVDRVNSMGLAQLLKLFEHWQKQNITIYITQVNRMITVLFKMTGLTRFLASNTESQNTEPVPAPVSPTRIIAEVPTQNIPPPIVDLTAFAGLVIEPSPSATALVQRFNFVGIVDVEAIKSLEALYVIPANSEVELNFAQVQRVNSMGLAQLLKLFEYWQKQQIAIRIINSNRMIEVLFKMTGLTRFLSEPSAKVSSTPPQPLVEKNQTPVSILQAPIAPVAIPSPSSMQSVASTAKLKLWVNVQSSQQMNGWYFFNTYLQRQIGKEVHLELIHGAMSERDVKIEDMDIVFTKPFEATRLFLEHEFQPLLRPIDQTDEVTLLVRANDPREQLSDYQGGKVVTAAANNFVYLLGRFLLEENDNSLNDMEYLFSGHDIKALQMLLKGSADILFMLSETYRGLSGLTKKNLRQIDQSETAFAFHLFSVSPRFSDMGIALSNVLLDMSLDSQGRQVLADLGIPGWIKPTKDECDMLAMLYKRYVVH